MKPYIHNPRLYQHHYTSQIGSALPGFEGVRMHRGQRGRGTGSLLSKLAGKAIPLIMSGMRMAKPHMAKAAKGLAKEVTEKVTQEAVARLTGTKKKIPNKTRTLRKPAVRKRKRTKRTTSPDIFS